MSRTVLYGALLLAAGVAAGAFVGSRRGETGPPVAQEPSGRSASTSRTSGTSGDDGGRGAVAALERRVERLAATLALEANEQHRLDERLEALAAELAALRGGADSGGNSSASASLAPPPSGDAPTRDAAEPAAAQDAASATERALVAAGVDPATAADIKRRRDELTLSELYLRDQAEREQWLDSPRFKEAMAEIDRQRTTIRDDIGDDAYDRYLAALGEPNRVTVDEVLSDSVAAQAGLQSGDVVLRYGDTRIFAPGELVAETRGGTAGESVSVEILRNGQRIQIDVPRGPLGLRIASSRGNPDGS